MPGQKPRYGWPQGNFPGHVNEAYAGLPGMQCTIGNCALHDSPAAAAGDTAGEIGSVHTDVLYLPAEGSTPCTADPLFSLPIHFEPIIGCAALAYSME